MIDKLILISFLTISFNCVNMRLPKVGPAGPQGTQGIQGPIGAKGEQGLNGEKGIPGKGFSTQMLSNINTLLNQSNNEEIVDISAYSFGIAPRITGFIYLSNYGNLYTYENKNPKVLGDKIEFKSNVNKANNFISISRTAYGDDVKQFFTISTKSGETYVSEDLISWKTSPRIQFDK